MTTNITALSRLLMAERTALLRRVRGVVGRDGAEDVVQKVWLKIQSVRDDPPITNPRAYLRRLTHNVAIDHVRDDKRRDDLHAEAMSLLHHGVDNITSERVVLAQDELSRIEQVIASLPDITQRIFRLSRIEGMTQREIVAHIGVSRPTVEKHLRRAFDAVAAALDRQS